MFIEGIPIPKRDLPPENAVEYYTDPKNRGYLADPDLIALERFKLAQKYGYVLPDLKQDSQTLPMMLERKDPRQIFYGLHPGWVINMKDKKIYEPTDERLREFYTSWAKCFLPIGSVDSSINTTSCSLYNLLENPIRKFRIINLYIPLFVQDPGTVTNEARGYFYIC